MKKFCYKLINPDNNTEFLEKIKKIDGVTYAELGSDTLEYGVETEADEYQTLAEIVDICDGEGVTVVFDYDESTDEGIGDNGLIDGLIDENTDKTEDKSAEPEKRAVSEYDIVDKLDEKKKSFKKESYMRVGELAVALILILVSYFLKDTGKRFSLKMILCVVSFAICAYEVVFDIFGDVKNKNLFSGNLVVTIACVLGVLTVGPIAPVTVMWVFSAGKFIESVAVNVSDFKTEESFYTGTLPVTVNGELTFPEDVKEGDEISLFEGGVVPCDSVALSDAEVDNYLIDSNPQKVVSSGETVYAGAVALADLKLKALKNYGESEIDKRREDFATLKRNSLGTKSEKIKKVCLYVDFALILIALAVAFILPAFAYSYKTAFVKWAQIGTAILIIGTATRSLQLVALSVFGAFASARTATVEYRSFDNFKKIAKANSVEISASALIENGELKEDSLGALRELLSLGVKNVTTDFDTQLAPEVKKQINFVNNAFNGERKIYVGVDKGDIALGDAKGDTVKIGCGEISFVPLAYKIAKSAYGRMKITLATSIVFKILALVAVFTVPVAVFNPLFIAAIETFITLVCALIAALSVRNNH